MTRTAQTKLLRVYRSDFPAFYELEDAHLNGVVEAEVGAVVAALLAQVTVGVHRALSTAVDRGSVASLHSLGVALVEVQERP